MEPETKTKTDHQATVSKHKNHTNHSERGHDISKAFLDRNYKSSPHPRRIITISLAIAAMDPSHHAAALAILLLLLVVSPPAPAVAQTVQSQPDSAPQPDVAVSFRPSIAIVIGIFSIMFSLTFLLLMYAKFCNSAAAGLYGHDNDTRLPNGLAAAQFGVGTRFSGIDKTVIESLPFFRFSTLRGSKEGLECAVCLSRFEDSEVLRLLPKCKHAFHIDCVDRWLENHSSCPLCRHKVEVEDLAMFKYSNSSRSLFSSNPPEPARDEDGILELFVEREVGGEGERRHGTSLRFSIGGSFRKIVERGKKAQHQQRDESLLPARGPRGADDEQLHKFKHRIIVSDVVFKNRWSDLNSADLASLNSDMLNVVSSRRFSALDSISDRFVVAKRPAVSENGTTVPGPEDAIWRIKEEMERKRVLESKAVSISIPHLNHGRRVATAAAEDTNPPDNSRCGGGGESLMASGKRSISEITNLPRTRVVADAADCGSGPVASAGSAKEERVRRLWLPIARRTVQWLASREKRSRPVHAVPEV